ncbi:MAG: prepilin-type N-terminal cleavage/methylation domain-containing protein [Desulfuromonadales bacterium]|nr:prepilin-type N-terminal cleavage/methylation domain-containing protein [Desulfuromonadales bacterium]
MTTNSKGFTLVELIVVMLVFGVIISIAGGAFKTILSHSTRLVKSEESNIEGLIGLEMFRHDLEQVGFGLPGSYGDAIVSYTEASTGSGTVAGRLNDAPSGVPRAVAGANNIPAGLDDTTSYSGTGSFRLLPGTDYLSIKASSVGTNEASQRWSYINYSSESLGSKPPKTWQSKNLLPGDRVIILNRTFANGVYKNTLMADTNTTPANYWASYSNSGLAGIYSPKSPEQFFYVYGITPSGTTPGMPFNRADYFVGIPSTSARIPDVCASEIDGGGNRLVGILYKATVNHANGKLTYMPILDCVADMQVIYGWNFRDSTGTVSTDADVMGDGLIDTWSTPLNSDGTGPNTVSGAASAAQVSAALLDPALLSARLKTIKVYILAQVGRRDREYTYVNTNPVTGVGATDIFVGPVDNSGRPETLTLGRVFPLKPAGGADLTHYRWKVYRLIITPKNLTTNN